MKHTYIYIPIGIPEPYYLSIYVVNSYHIT